MVEVISVKYHKQFQNEEIAGSGRWNIAIPQSAIDEHKFMNENVVINTSSSDLRVVPDNDTSRSYIVPAKGSFAWSFKDDNMKFSSLYIDELSGNVISANALQVIVMKKRFEVVNNG